MAVVTRLTGTVTAFDDHRGYGSVTGIDGRNVFLHCTAIADGTRTIEVGVAVTFDVFAGTLGQWEASDLRLA